MSATEREPFATRLQRNQELDLLIVQAEAELAEITKQATAALRRLAALRRAPTGAVAWPIIAGVLSLPVVIIFGMLLCAPVIQVIGR